MIDHSTSGIDFVFFMWNGAFSAEKLPCGVFKSVLNIVKTTLVTNIYMLINRKSSDVWLLLNPKELAFQVWRKKLVWLPRSHVSLESILRKVEKRLPGNGTRIETRPGGSRKALEQIRSGRVNVLGFQDQTIIPDPKQLHRTLDMMSGKTVKIQVSSWTAYTALCTMRTSLPNINKSPCYR